MAASTKCHKDPEWPHAPYAPRSTTILRIKNHVPRASERDSSTRLAWTHIAIDDEVCAPTPDIPVHNAHNHHPSVSCRDHPRRDRERPWLIEHQHRGSYAIECARRRPVDKATAQPPDHSSRLLTATQGHQGPDSEHASQRHGPHKMSETHPWTCGHTKQHDGRSRLNRVHHRRPGSSSDVPAYASMTLTSWTVRCCGAWQSRG